MADRPFKTFLRRLARRALDFARHEGGPVMNCPGHVAGLDRASVRVTAHLVVEDPQAGGATRVMLGRGVYIGERVLLAASRAGDVHVGDHTSLQNDCMVGGDVRIGAHCLFGKYVFVSSTRHRYADNPTWLIKDQDCMADAGSATLTPPLSRQIVIEDDCWIGQGVVVSPGVEIGRGAVVGANCVVTKDIAPYEIHGGAPNRRIGTRLIFAPPASLSAEKDEHLPYFYRGFRLSQDDLSAGRAQGVVRSQGPSLLALARGKRLTLRGHCESAMAIGIRIHGMACGTHEIAGDFALSLDVPAGDTGAEIPRALQPFMPVEITPASSLAYGIAAAVSET